MCYSEFHVLAVLMHISFILPKKIAKLVLNNKITTTIQLVVDWLPIILNLQNNMKTSFQ